MLVAYLFLYRVINTLVAILSLALVLRVTLAYIGISVSHPVMRVLYPITEPLLAPLHRYIGGRSVVWSGRYLDLLPLIALMLLWVARVILLEAIRLVCFPPLWLFTPWNDPVGWVRRLLALLIQLYELALLVRIVLEWLRLSYAHPALRFLWDITEPPLALIRRYLRPVGGLDFSPLLLFVLLDLVRGLLAI